MTEALTPEQISGYRDRLIALQQRVTGTLDTLEAGTVGTPSDPIEHEGDRRSADGEFREADLDAAANEADAATRIAAAIDRVDAGQYGRCIACQAWIPQGRLDTLPFAERCVPCQEAFEAEQA